MEDVELEYRVPPQELQPFVSLFYHFRVERALLEDTERAANAQFRFILSAGEGGYAFPGEDYRAASPCHVIGPTNVAMQVRAVGPVEVVGFGVQPAGWAAMLGVEATALVNRVVDASTLFGTLAQGARERLLAATTREAKFDLIAEFARSLIARGRSRELSFAREIDAWLASAPSPDLAVLLAATGLSRRQLERRCNALYGAPPKMLARKYRALRAATALSSGTATIDTLIGEAFYDQSHLIRELKQFTGLTPRQLLARPSFALSSLTMSGRGALRGHVDPIISQS